MKECCFDSGGADDLRKHVGDPCCLPFRRVEGKHPVTAWIRRLLFPERMKSASNGWSGTGPSTLCSSANLLGHTSKYDARGSFRQRNYVMLAAQAFDIRRPVPAAKSSECVPALGGYTRLHTPVRGENHRFVSLVVLRGQSAWGSTPGFAELGPYFGHAYTPDMTRRVFGRVSDWQDVLPFFKALSTAPLPGSMPSAILFPSWEQAVSENSLVAFYGVWPWAD